VALTDVVINGRTPHGRRVVLSEAQAAAFVAGETPVMVTEFGGIALGRQQEDREDAWGYSSAGSEAEYAELLRRQFEALRASSELAGFCYTQFMDTGQETNGLLFADGTPKLSVGMIREIVTGEREAPVEPVETPAVPEEQPAAERTLPATEG
jgi:hypothetical protein